MHTQREIRDNKMKRHLKKDNEDTSRIPHQPHRQALGP